MNLNLDIGHSACVNCRQCILHCLLVVFVARAKNQRVEYSTERTHTMHARSARTQPAHTGYSSWCVTVIFFIFSLFCCAPCVQYWMSLSLVVFVFRLSCWSVIFTPTNLQAIMLRQWQWKYGSIRQPSVAFCLLPVHLRITFYSCHFDLFFQFLFNLRRLNSIDLFRFSLLLLPVVSDISLLINDRSFSAQWLSFIERVIYWDCKFRFR